MHPLLRGIPTTLYVDDKKEVPTAGWRERCLSSSRECSAFWDDDAYNTLAGFSYLPGSQLVIFTLPIAGDVSVFRSTLETFPFEIAALSSPHRPAWLKAGRRTWAFGRSHVLHGWACAFRGAGHDRLVSRRWLDFGPWRVMHRPDDTTFIQFHDLAITDPEEAYAQAAPGHQRMGIDPIGGFIQGIDEDVIKEVKGVFIPETRTLEIPIAPGIEVTQQDMRVACALRLWHRMKVPAAQRIEHIAYVFIEKADAYAHLHELWLRELECWYMDEAGRHRIDTEYQPTPNPPEWVKRLDAR
jgi:hypothetical protein